MTHDAAATEAVQTLALRPISGGLTEAETSRDGWLIDRPLILVVDDDADARELIALMLQARGYAVVQAASGGEALAIAATAPVAAVLLDVVMPQESGFEVCKALRDQDDTRSIPVVMLTALDGVTDEVTGTLAGADAYLTKPVSVEDLVIRLRDVI